MRFLSLYGRPLAVSLIATAVLIVFASNGIWKIPLGAFAVVVFYTVHLEFRHANLRRQIGERSAAPE